MKVGTAVVSCRRGGNTATFDVLNKYFTIGGIGGLQHLLEPVHGFTADDVRKDLEGLQTMRALPEYDLYDRGVCRRKEKYGYPELETGCFTNCGRRFLYRQVSQVRAQEGDMDDSSPR